MPVRALLINLLKALVRLWEAKLALEMLIEIEVRISRFDKSRSILRMLDLVVSRILRTTLRIIHLWESFLAVVENSSPGRELIQTRCQLNLP